MTASHTTFSAAERLLKSADSLDFALSNQDKKNVGLSRQGLLDFGSLDTIFGSTEISTTLFDDWLSNDLQQVGFMSQDESSSDSDASSSSPTLSTKSDSPAVGFDSIASDAELIQSSGFDSTMALFPDMSAASPTRAFGTPAATNAPMLPLTPESVQQAAAALNIPWSKGLEEAVLAQSLLASFPMALAMPLRQASPTAVATQPMTGSMLPKLGASMAVAHVPERSMEMSSPSTPMTMASPAMSTRSVEMECAKTSTVAATPAPAIPATSTAPRSLLSCTQTAVAGATNVVQAMTYKSTYRSASLLKRDREFDEPPSVLDGKDISEMDEVSLKRAKNTDAARRSRRKKLMKMESLEQRVAELEVENSMFESKLNEVELERSLLADKDQMQQARIQELELMLSSMREKMY